MPERAESQYQEHFCPEHTNHASGIAVVSSKLTTMLWLLGGNGALLLIILGTILTGISNDAVQAEKLKALETRIEMLEVQSKTK